MSSNLRNNPRRPRRDDRRRVMLVGEGPHDIGRKASPGGALAGFMTSIMRGPGEIASADDQPFEIVEVRKWTEIALQPNKLRRRSFQDILHLDGDSRRVQACLTIGEIKGYDVVAVMKDCESFGNANSLGERLRKVAKTGQQDEPDAPGLIIATPSRSHETWLLADSDAVIALLDSDSCYHFSGDAECRPNAQALKAHIRKHCKRCKCEETDFRISLAYNASPNAIVKRCKRCYPPFVEDVRRELMNDLN